MMVSTDARDAPWVQCHLRKAGAVTLATNSFLECYANRFLSSIGDEVTSLPHRPDDRCLSGYRV